jgi:protein arginine kinase activator
MLCQACKEKSATIHLTEINNGQRCETHLCSRCAQQQGVSIKTQIPLNELLNTLISVKPQGDEQAQPSLDAAADHPCPVCGMTLKEFASEPLLGCPHDYSEFQEQLLPLIERSQGGQSHHSGKVPSRTGDQDRKNIELINLRRQLDQAIKNEDYETAAGLRDQIQALE